MNEILERIRPTEYNSFPIRRKIVRMCLMIVLGLVLGTLAKFLDSYPIVGEIGSRMGIWILTATLIAVFSRSPRSASIHVFVFFVSLLLAYYLYTALILKFFPKYYMLTWACFAIISPFAAYIAWFGRGNGWIAALCAALPIGFLISEGHSFYYTVSIVQGFDLLAAAVLFAFVPKNWQTRFRLLPFAAITAFVMGFFDIFSRVFGTLYS